jgi:hypothetical protein
MKIENKHKDTKNACASKPTLSVSNSSPSPHEKLVHQERRSPRRPKLKDLRLLFFSTETT